MLVLTSAFADENAVQQQLGIAVSVETLITAKTKVTSCMEYVLVCMEYVLLCSLAEFVMCYIFSGDILGFLVIRDMLYQLYVLIH